MKTRYRFSELGREHQAEVICHLGHKAAAKTVWELVLDFPVDQAVAITCDFSVRIADGNDHVESVVRLIEHAGKVRRPILIDDDEDAPWIEGMHRSIASDKLGLKTIPALVRVR